MPRPRTLVQLKFDVLMCSGANVNTTASLLGGIGMEGWREGGGGGTVRVDSFTNKMMAL